MLKVPGHDAVSAGAYGTFNKDGIFIITVFIAERVLAVDAERINQAEDNKTRGTVLSSCQGGSWMSRWKRKESISRQ